MVCAKFFSNDKEKEKFVRFLNCLLCIFLILTLTQKAKCLDMCRLVLFE